MSPRRFVDISKTCPQDVFKTCLEDAFKRCLQDVFKTSSRRLQRNNFSSSKTSWKRKIVSLKTYWRRLQDMSWRHLEDVLKTNKYLLEAFFFKQAYCYLRCVGLLGFTNRSTAFVNNLTKKIGYNCLYIFHLIYPENGI